MLRNKDKEAIELLTQVADRVIEISSAGSLTPEFTD
jgi:hypothetical protein